MKAALQLRQGIQLTIKYSNLPNIVSQSLEGLEP